MQAQHWTQELMLYTLLCQVPFKISVYPHILERDILLMEGETIILLLLLPSGQVERISQNLEQHLTCFINLVAR